MRTHRRGFLGLIGGALAAAGLSPREGKALVEGAAGEARLAPQIYGKCLNVPPVIWDRASLLYRISSGPLRAIPYRGAQGLFNVPDDILPRLAA